MNATRWLNLFEGLKSFACRAGFQGVVAAVGVAAACTSAHAATITFNAVQDTTVYDRPSNGTPLQRDTNYNGQGLQTWNNNSGNATNGRRRAVFFQFDLSSLPASSTITGAHLEYYDTGAGDYTGSNNNAFANDTSIAVYNPSATDEELKAFNAAGDLAFDRSGMYEQYVTYNSAGSSQLTRPGSPWSELFAPIYTSMDLVLAANNATGYQAAGNADSAALAKLNTVKDNMGFALFSVWYSGTNGRSFGDKESGNPVKLVLEVEAVPEPASAVLALVGGIGVMSSLRRRHVENAAVV